MKIRNLLVLGLAYTQLIKIICYSNRITTFVLTIMKISVLAHLSDLHKNVRETEMTTSKNTTEKRAKCYHRF